MEKSKSIKRKILISAFSILVCVLAIGVSVYAALTQTTNLNNKITISTAGQTKVGVVVSEYINAEKTAVTTSPSGEVSWTQKLSKGQDEDTATQELTTADFNYTAGKNYYAWKLDFTNSNNSDAYAHIVTTAVDNSQITIYTGSEWGSLTALANNTAGNGTVALAKEATGTYYVVVASNTSLDSLTAAEGQLPFNITITLDQNA